MFGRFRGFRDRLKKKGVHVEQELTLDNSNLTPSQIATAQKALKILGLETRKQALTKQDFIVFLYAMGLNPTEDIIDSKIRAFKLHNKKTFSFGQLAHVWYSMLQDLTDEDEILKRAFQFFDKDGNGEISVQELRTTMHELGDLLSEEEISAFMAIMDVNNDGVIGYNEFLATLKTQAPELVGDHARLKGDAGQADKSVGMTRTGARHFHADSIVVPASPVDTLAAAAAALSPGSGPAAAATERPDPGPDAEGPADLPGGATADGGELPLPASPGSPRRQASLSDSPLASLRPGLGQGLGPKEEEEKEGASREAAGAATAAAGDQAVTTGRDAAAAGTELQQAESTQRSTITSIDALAPPARSSGSASGGSAPGPLTANVRQSSLRAPSTLEPASGCSSPASGGSPA